MGTGLAGCGEDGDNNGDIGEGDPADASVRVVNAAPSTDGDGGGSAVTPDGAQSGSDALEITELTYQQAGSKGLVVAGNVENTGEEPFEEVLVEATLYDGNPQEDNLFDSASNQSNRDEFEAGDVWQWAVTFRENPAFDIDHYAVTISGWYD